MKAHGIEYSTRWLCVFATFAFSFRWQCLFKTYSQLWINFTLTMVKRQPDLRFRVTTQNNAFFSFKQETLTVRELRIWAFCDKTVRASRGCNGVLVALRRGVRHRAKAAPSCPREALTARPRSFFKRKTVRKWLAVRSGFEKNNVKFAELSRRINVSLLFLRPPCTLMSASFSCPHPEGIFLLRESEWALTP